MSMPTPTPADIKAFFPQFFGETDARLQVFINLADPYFDVDRWGGFYFEGLVNFVAHEVTMANAAAKAGSAGPGAGDNLTKKVGDVAVGKDSALLNLQAKDPYMRTLYGQKYASLRRLVGMGAVVI
jgi:Protein of unknown function (DUF4054)